MMRMRTTLLLLLCLLLIACSDSDAQVTPTATMQIVEIIAPTATAIPEPTATRSYENSDFIQVAMDVPDRSGQFADFDAFGNVVGLDADMLAAITSQAGLDYELIVTAYDGMLDSVANGEFSAAMARIELPGEPIEGIAFTEPYLEIGQVMMVRADEAEIISAGDVPPAEPIAIVAGTAASDAAQAVLGLPQAQLVEFSSSTAALQALSDFEVRAAIVNHFDAEMYAERYYQRLKLLGAESDAFFITSQQYVIAVAQANSVLLERLNAAIGATNSAEIAQQWLLTNEPIVTGDSLIGTPADRLLIGVSGQFSSFDPSAAAYNPIEWEVRQNTFSGLVGFDADNNLVPLLAESLPQISAEGNEYSFTLRSDLTFNDGTPLDAEAVAQSMRRSAATANPLFAILLDSNIDGFADDAAIVVIDRFTIKFVLNEPDSTFLSRAATPAFAVINPTCDFANFDPTANCDGIGPYFVDSYEPGVAIRLNRNPNWFGEAANMEKVELRFYQNSAEMSQALANDAIDIAWRGLNDSDQTFLDNLTSVQRWQGPGIFKSYLVFEHSEGGPWDDVQVRQAAALAIDRWAIAAETFGGDRSPLYSPLPDGVPGQISIEPSRDLERATALLQASGWSSDNPLEIDLFYLNDGRYTDREDDYAQAIAAQLEETGIFKVTLTGEGWATFSTQMSSCNYPTFLLGWPPTDRPPYLDGMGWIAHFIYNATTVCSNYESEAMLALLDRLFLTTNSAERLAIYAEIQTLWAEELPTLDIYQETLDAYALNKVENVVIDGLGLMDYAQTSKRDE